MADVVLTLLEGQLSPYGDPMGEIRIDTSTERFSIDTSYWSLEQYETQWRSALRQLSEGASAGCVIASISYSSTANLAADLWVFYREGETVIFQNRLVLVPEMVPQFEPASPEQWLPAREQFSEEGQPISEWMVDARNLRTCVRRAATAKVKGP